LQIIVLLISIITILIIQQNNNSYTLLRGFLMSGSFRYSLIASAILFSYSSWAADDTPETTPSTRADTVTVVGNWLDSPDYDTVVLDHAGARTIVTREQAKEKGAETVAEALRGIPGVQVQENNGTGGSDVSLNVGVRG
jgi:Fe(3+) dicitrate transport protein